MPSIPAANYFLIKSRQCNRALSKSSFRAPIRRQISRSLYAARLGAIMLVSLWNLTSISAVLLAIWNVSTRISELRDLTRSGGKTSVQLVNKGLDHSMKHYNGITPRLLIIISSHAKTLSVRISNTHGCLYNGRDTRFYRGNLCLKYRIYENIWFDKKAGIHQAPKEDFRRVVCVVVSDIRQIPGVR